MIIQSVANLVIGLDEIADQMHYSAFLTKLFISNQSFTVVGVTKMIDKSYTNYY